MNWSDRLARFFAFEEKGTTFRREISGGVVTFLTMSYIIFVQPAVLSQAGMDFNAVMMATCLSAALASILMGLLANYPVVLAPGMGENFFFAFTVVIMLKVAWQQALAMVFISGIVFVILTLTRVRQKFIEAIPASLKYSIAAGIGLFIGFIGLVDAGIVIRNNAPLNAMAFGKTLDTDSIITKLNQFEYSSGALKMGDFSHPATLVSIVGLLLLSVLLVKRVKGAMLWGLLLTAAIGLMVGVVKWKGLVAAPPSMAPTLFKLSFSNLFTLDLIPIVLVFLIMDFLDTIGTLVGVSSRAGLLRDGKLPRASRALMADAVGTVAGALMGTSTVTSYIESAAGVEEGGRTGFTALVGGGLFALAIFFSPLIQMIGGGYVVSTEYNIKLYPITAPVLIVVGTLMIRELAKVKWEDFSDAIPAFLTAVGIPLTYSVSDGLAIGFLSYTLIKLMSGKWRDLNPILLVVTLFLLIRFIFVKF